MTPPWIHYNRQRNLSRVARPRLNPLNNPKIYFHLDPVPLCLKLRLGRCHLFGRARLLLRPVKRLRTPSHLSSPRLWCWNYLPRYVCPLRFFAPARHMQWHAIIVIRQRSGRGWTSHFKSTYGPMSRSNTASRSLFRTEDLHGRPVVAATPVSVDALQAIMDVFNLSIPCQLTLALLSGSPIFVAAARLLDARARLSSSKRYPRSSSMLDAVCDVWSRYSGFSYEVD